ncbi:unnamed protein product [Lactuca virosa]|uniref:Uncharacterized protein n=1 Tax=Lactuca virosa TaxID=75947 RepID=A0AAU9PCX1_9ASTR|nr:unnamed protein product [Lactuca virosa]
MTEQRQPEGEAIHEVTDEIEELDKLEEDVNLMAQKIAEFRETLPAQLQNTLDSILSAQRPVNFNLSDNDHGPSSNANQEEGVVALVEDDVAHTEKIETIKQKVSSNDSAMLSVVKRMKDCISRIEKLDSFNKGIIHPAFKTRNIISQDRFT